jgi:hypothetical protein
MIRRVARLLGISVAMVAGGAGAEDDTRFTKAKEGAEPLASLGAFLVKYLTDCGPPSGEAQECKRNAEAFRTHVNGKKQYTVVDEESAQLQVANVRGDSFTFNLTPFFAASNSAITLGAPSRTDASGNPVIPFLAIEGKSPEAMSPQMIGRLAGGGDLRAAGHLDPAGEEGLCDWREDKVRRGPD